MRWLNASPANISGNRMIIFILPLSSFNRHSVSLPYGFAFDFFSYCLINLYPMLA